MKKILGRHIRTALFIILSGIVLLEAVWFLAGRYLLWHRRINMEIAHAVRIVCAGDSHTFGVGTSMAYSYPSQLGKLLTLNNDQQKFSVINLGVPGAGTMRQEKELESFFNAHTADAVILLTGRNNDLEVKNFRDVSLSAKFRRFFNSLRTVRFFKGIAARGKKDDFRNNKFDPEYGEYLSFYLKRISRLCAGKNAKLILLSYYNSSDKRVKEFADRNGILYVDLSEDFNSLFKGDDREKYISADMSHMNHKGYKFFAEQLYGHLFLQQSGLGFKINPLFKKTQETDFYSNDKDIELMLDLQKERVAYSKNTDEYPFELIHLGHIYMEIKNEQEAQDCYWKALRSSGYSDNNTIVSPIINWYLKNGQKDAALQACDEILTHNPKNNIAASYRNWLTADRSNSENGMLKNKH